MGGGYCGVVVVVCPAASLAEDVVRDENADVSVGVLLLVVDLVVLCEYVVPGWG